MGFDDAGLSGNPKLIFFMLFRWNSDFKGSNTDVLLESGERFVKLLRQNTDYTVKQGCPLCSILASRITNSKRDGHTGCLLELMAVSKCDVTADGLLICVYSVIR